MRAYQRKQNGKTFQMIGNVLIAVSASDVPWRFLAGRMRPARNDMALGNAGRFRRAGGIVYGRSYPRQGIVC